LACFTQLSTLREQLENNEVLTKLLREELQACERQVVGLEMTRESDNVSGELSQQLSHSASDLGSLTKEIDRYKGLYGDSFDIDEWAFNRKKPDLERDSLDISSARGNWDDDAAEDSSDSLEHPFPEGLVSSRSTAISREDRFDSVPARRASPVFSRSFDINQNGSPGRNER